MIKLIFSILFSAAMILVALYSLTMIYVLLRYGKSKILGLVLSVFYIIIAGSLYAAAQANFDKIPFPEF